METKSAMLTIRTETLQQLRGCGSHVLLLTHTKADERQGRNHGILGVYISATGDNPHAFFSLILEIFLPITSACSGLRHDEPLASCSDSQVPPLLGPADASSPAELIGLAVYPILRPCMCFPRHQFQSAHNAAVRF